MINNIFPINIPAYEGETYTSSHPAFRKDFLVAFKKSSLRSWYAYDARIISPTTVTFTVYEMYDNCYGGIGSIIGVFENVEVSRDVTEPFIEKKIWRLASEQRAKELAEKEEQYIRAIANQIKFDSGLYRP